MIDNDAHSQTVTIKELQPGEIILAQGSSTETAYVLESGELEVLRDGQLVGTVSERGAVVGEIAFLLKTPHQATVIAKTASKVLVLDKFGFIATDHPVLMSHMAETLARRLLATNSSLAALKAQLSEILAEKQINATGNKEIKGKLVEFWNAFDRVMTTKIAEF